MRIAACGSDVDGLCRCHEHCRAARDRISARSDRDRGTLSLPPSYIRLISTRLNERKTQEEHVDDGDPLV